MEPGKAYRIDMLGAETGDGTLADPYLAGLKAVYNVNDNQNDNPDDDVYVYVPDGLKDSEGDRFTNIWREWQDDTAHLRGTYYNDDGGQGYNARMFVRAHPSALLGDPAGLSRGRLLRRGQRFRQFHRHLPDDADRGNRRQHNSEIADLWDPASRNHRLPRRPRPVLDQPHRQRTFAIQRLGRRDPRHRAAYGFYGTGAGPQVKPNRPGAALQLHASVHRPIFDHGERKRGQQTASRRRPPTPSRWRWTRKTHPSTPTALRSTPKSPLAETSTNSPSTLHQGTEDSKTFRIDVKGLDSGDGTLPNLRIRVSRKHGGSRPHLQR